MKRNETEQPNSAGTAPKTGLEYQTYASCNCLPDDRDETVVRFQAVDIRGELTPERFGELLENFLGGIDLMEVLMQPNADYGPMETSRLSFDQESLVADPTQPITGNMQVIDRKRERTSFEGRILMEFEDPAERRHVMTAAYRRFDSLLSQAVNEEGPIPPLPQYDDTRTGMGGAEQRSHGVMNPVSRCTQRRNPAPGC